MIVETDGYYLVDARVDIGELEDKFEGLTFPEDREYGSLGGFMSEEAGRVPQPGESVVFNGYVFTAVTSEPTHVVSVRIEETDLTDQEHAESGDRKSVAV
jgi:putative hemolysin